MAAGDQYQNQLQLSGTLRNCSQQQLWPYSSNLIGYYYNHNEKQMGEFDLHLDRLGNLRIFHNGKMVGEFKPCSKK